VPNLTLEQLTVALALVAGAALVALLLAVTQTVRLSRLRRDYALLRGEHGEQDILAAVGRGLRKINALDDRLDTIVSEQQQQAALGRHALQKFHVVRYDAFEDMGGRLSFSAALLDDHGDGLVITSINGRTETRTYAKPVKNLASEFNLSEEEREAIAGAVARFGRGDRSN
jgi:hypothetical protein